MKDRFYIYDSTTGGRREVSIHPLSECLLIYVNEKEGYRDWFCGVEGILDDDKIWYFTEAQGPVLVKKPESLLNIAKDVPRGT